MTWFFLALLCAFSLATADAFTKRYLGDYRPFETVVVRFGYAGVLLLPVLFVLPWPAPDPAFWWWLAALVPLEVLAMLLYVMSLRADDLARTLPYQAFTPVFATLTGYWILGERVSVLGFAGIALVTAGAYGLNLHRVKGTDGRSDWLMPLKAIWHDRGPRLMMGVAALYSVTSVLGKGAMQYVPSNWFGAFYYAVLGAVTLLVLGLWQPGTLRALSRRPAPQVLVGLFMALMVFTHFLAIQLVEVAYMISVKRTSLLFGILWGAVLFREKRLGPNLVAGSVMVAGVALILI